METLRNSSEEEPDDNDFNAKLPTTTQKSYQAPMDNSSHTRAGRRRPPVDEELNRNEHQYRHPYGEEVRGRETIVETESTSNDAGDYAVINETSFIVNGDKTMVQMMHLVTLITKTNLLRIKLFLLKLKMRKLSAPFGSKRCFTSN